jgi:hypothetical protein
MKSPLNNKVVSFNTVVVSFTLTRPSSNWFIGETSCWVSGVKIIVDGAVYRSVAINSELPVPLSYSLNLTDLENGAHSLQLNAYCRGVSMIRGLPGDRSPYIYCEALSDTVSFTVDAPEPTSTPTPTPTTPTETTPTSSPYTALEIGQEVILGVAVTVAAIGAGLGLLVYLIKRN